MGKERIIWCTTSLLAWGSEKKPRITSVKFSCQRFEPGNSQILSSSDHLTTTMTCVYIYFIISYFFCLLLALYVLFFCSLSWVCLLYWYTHLSLLSGALTFADYVVSNDSGGWSVMTFKRPCNYLECNYCGLIDSPSLNSHGRAEVNRE